MNIAVVFHDPDYHSGATHSMIDIIESWLKRNNISITCIFPKEGTATARLKENGVRVLLADYDTVVRDNNESKIKTIVGFPLRQYRIIRGYLSIRSLLNNQLVPTDFDLVYTNTSTLYAGYWIQKRLNIPHLWHIREFGLEDQEWVPIKGKRHYSIINSANKIITISKALSNKYKKYIESDKISVVYNDINKKQVKQFKRDWTVNRINILSCGTVIEGKGHKQVIDATKLMVENGMDVCLHIAGSTNSDYAKTLIQYIEDNDMSTYIKILGHVTNMDKLREQMHITVVASRSEAFGRITIEGMLSGLALVGADTGATPELIIDGESGFIYKWGDVEDLYNKLSHLYLNRHVLEEISDKGKMRAEVFSKGSAADNIYLLINELMDN